MQEHGSCSGEYRGRKAQHLSYFCLGKATDDPTGTILHLLQTSPCQHPAPCSQEPAAPTIPSHPPNPVTEDSVCTGTGRNLIKPNTFSYSHTEGCVCLCTCVCTSPKSQCCPSAKGTRAMSAEQASQPDPHPALRDAAVPCSPAGHIDDHAGDGAGHQLWP